MLTIVLSVVAICLVNLLTLHQVVSGSTNRHFYKNRQRRASPSTRHGATCVDTVNFATDSPRGYDLVATASRLAVLVFAVLRPTRIEAQARVQTKRTCPNSIAPCAW
jgi:hypothetical protein